jgi:hypothetical protein
VLQPRLELSQARSRSGAQVTFGTRVGVPTGTGEAATIAGGDLDPTLIPIRTGDRDGVRGDRLRVGLATKVTVNARDGRGEAVAFSFYIAQSRMLGIAEVSEQTVMASSPGEENRTHRHCNSRRHRRDQAGENLLTFA